jgi:hypothetical protein
MKILSCVIIDGDGPGETARHLAAELELRGHRAVMLGSELDAKDFTELSALVHPQRVVFAPPARDECDALDLDLTGRAPEHLAPLVAAGVKRFLRLTQVAILGLMGNGGGQIWVADWDDTFEYHLPLPCSPLQAEARAAAVRAMAKECARLGIKINSLSVQPVAEMFPPEQFRAARDDLKAYALRYKPVSCSTVAALLCDFLERPDLPMAGAMVGLGNGVCQGHLIQ